MDFLKHLNWDFAEPGKKPRGPVEIDWQHWLGSKIDVYLPLTIGSIAAEAKARTRVDLISNSGTPYFVDGKACIDYERTSSQYSQINTGLNVSDSETQWVSFWIHIESLGSTAWLERPFSIVGDTDSWGVYFRSYLGGKVLVWTSGGNTGDVAVGIPTATWTQFAFCFDQPNNEIRIYKNGLLSSTVSGYTDNSAIANLKIFLGSDSAGENTIDGKIADFIYGRGDFGDREALELYQNPYAFLRPASPQYFPIGAAANDEQGGTTEVSADLSDSYDILNATAVDSDLSDSYTIQSSVDADLGDSYVIRTTADADLGDSYTITQSVVSDLGDSYSILSAGQVTNDLTDSYAIVVTTFSDLSDEFTIATTVQSELSDEYTIQQPVNQSLSDSYVITSGVASDLEDSYAIADAVSSDLADTYKITASVSSDLSDSYWVLATTGGGGLTSEQWLTIQQIAVKVDEIWRLQGLDAANPTTINEDGSITVGDVTVTANTTGVEPNRQTVLTRTE